MVVILSYCDESLFVFYLWINQSKIDPSPDRMNRMIQQIIVPCIHINLEDTFVFGVAILRHLFCFVGVIDVNVCQLIIVLLVQLSALFCLVLFLFSIHIALGMRS